MGSGVCAALLKVMMARWSFGSLGGVRWVKVG